jgi:formylmethanofuran dehydrogenase subunit B
MSNVKHKDIQEAYIQGKLQSKICDAAVVVCQDTVTRLEQLTLEQILQLTGLLEELKQSLSAMINDLQNGAGGSVFRSYPRS